MRGLLSSAPVHTRDNPFDALFTSLERAVADGVFPGCVALVWCDGATIYHEAHGMLASDPEVPEHARAVDRRTVYDLASLTKVLATTGLAALAVAENKMSLETPVPEPWCAACPGATLEHLLDHSAGLLAHREYFAELADAGRPWPGQQDAVMRLVCKTPPAYPLGTQAVYSDLGMMILGTWLERVYDAPLDTLFENRIAWPLGLHTGVVPRLGYNRVRRDGGRGPTDAQRGWVAPTEVYDHAAAARGEEVPTWYAVRKPVDYAHYEVHDDKALIMGGVAGHAGLFGDAEAVLEVAIAWLRCTLPGLDQATRDRFWRASKVPGSTRRLGWDGSARDGSGSTGKALSERAIGHLGYTGTSLWIDPGPAPHSRPRVFVLLSNRVHPGRDNTLITRYRPVFHQLAARLAEQ